MQPPKVTGEHTPKTVSSEGKHSSIYVLHHKYRRERYSLWVYQLFREHGGSRNLCKAANYDVSGPGDSFPPVTLSAFARFFMFALVSGVFSYVTPVGFYTDVNLSERVETLLFISSVKGLLLKPLACFIFGSGG